MHCGHDAKCLLATYDTIAIQLEKKFKLAAAIKVTKALIGVAEQEGLILKMAQGNYDVCRYYDALKNARYAVVYLDRALRYFEEADSPRKVVKCKFWKAKLTSPPDGQMTNAEREVLDTLIREAITLQDSILACNIIVHRFMLGMHFDPPEKSNAYLSLLMAIPKRPKRILKMHWLYLKKLKTPGELYMRSSISLKQTGCWVTIKRLKTNWALP